MTTVRQVAQNNGYPHKVTAKLHMNIKQKPETAYFDRTESQLSKTWTIFNYHSLQTRKVTGLSKNSNLNIAF
jgi:hypothetical protein